MTPGVLRWQKHKYYMPYTPYASAADLIARYDVRTIGDLCEDSGVRQTPTQILADPNVSAALDDATGTVNAAIFVANRYTPEQIAGLTNAGLAFLKRLTADLAFLYLVERRGTDVRKMPQWARVQESLDRIRHGDNVFDLTGAEVDGLPTVGFPTTQQFADLALERDYASRIFPVRRSQSPI